MHSRKMNAWFKMVSGTMALIVTGAGMMLARWPQSPVPQKTSIHNATSPNGVSLAEVKNLLSSTVIETKNSVPTKPPFSPPISMTKISRKHLDDSSKNPLRGQPPHDVYLRADVIKLLRAGKLNEAERKLRPVIALLRNTYRDGDLDRLMGDIQLEKGEYRNALENYHVNRPASMRHIPHYAELCLKIALCYSRLGEIKKAREFYGYAANNKLGQSIKTELPGVDNHRDLEASILINLGFYAETVADSERALGFYQAADKLAPRNGILAYVQARSLMDLKRYDEALPVWTRVIRFGNAEQVKDARSTMIQRWPRAQAEAAIREAAKIP